VRARGLLERFSTGASTQVLVAGAYAWAVTVAPIVWDRSAPAIAEVAACAALVALMAGAAGERRWGPRVRAVSLWTFVLASALAWLSAPASMRPARIDVTGGVAGMLGWAVFGLACAGPALGAPRETGRLVNDPPLEARRSVGRGDVAYVVAGLALALAFQLVGWQVESPERALLVRLVGVAGGLAFLGAATELALARQVPRERRPWRLRLRGARAMLALLGALALVGLLLATRD
jgi:hypothetical protein